MYLQNRYLMLICVSYAYTAHEQIPQLTPLPLFGLENEIRGGIFYGRLSRKIAERIQKPQLE